MKNQLVEIKEKPISPLRPALAAQISLVLENCINCTKCTAQCEFLKRYGTPGKISVDYNPSSITGLTLAYQCSLCGLCAAVCPVQLSPVDLFLEMRREAVDRGAGPLRKHKGIMGYERRGVSKKYSWYSLPDGCHTVLFPGCTFSGTRMDTTIKLYEHLKTRIPTLGIVLDCCCKPSHDLGRSAYFSEMFGELRIWLLDHQVETVIVACPNCYKVFKTWGGKLEVTSAYELLAGQHAPDMPDSGKRENRKIISIHDPCVLRDNEPIQTAVRKLAVAAGFGIEEMRLSKTKTVCCGEGGSVGCVAPELSQKWGEKRQKESGNRRLLTYCAGCANFLNKKVPTDHVLDALFFPETVAEGTRKAVKAPFTYLNRLRLKKYMMARHSGAITRERTFQGPSSKDIPGSGNLKKYLLLAVIAAAIAGIHFSGILRHFDAETLRETVASWGMLAPAIYMVIYTVAPVLFLPGLPITIAGGILFGPFWGVAYSITGATAGACAAFLISRYVARDWVAAKLTGPRWQSLDRNVLKNGWKIVAFTCLIPLFPFNLLNYAFGLTSIRFLPYAATSFICMMPACVAFIVFSSSLLDLVKGNVSPAFIVGILLVALVAMMPAMIKKMMNNE